ncbi:MAG: DUF72 domain-containing protein [Acidobacteriota bacterium]
MRGKGYLRVGTSGWHYAHWRGPFYPPQLAASGWFGFYARRFDAVELNATFYRLPSENAVARWRETAPPGFLYAVKASRFITHYRRLKNPEAGLKVFFDRIKDLGDTLGPVLFQLPPRFARNTELLGEFLQALPTGVRHAFEFRDPDWFHEDVYRLLARHGAAFCVYEYGTTRSPAPVTADFAYVRLHGPGRRYAGNYRPDELADWAGSMQAWAGQGLDAFCFFDNDEAGYAARNALELASLLKDSDPAQA